MRRLPIRTRVLAALLAVAVLPLVVFGAVMARELDLTVGLEQADALRHEAALAAAQLNAAPDRQAALDAIAGLTRATVTVFDAAGNVVAGSGAARAVPSPDPDAATAVVTRNDAATAYAPLSAAADATAAGAIVAVTEPAAGGTALLSVLLASVTATILAAVTLSVVLTRSLLRPLGHLSGTLDRIQAGDLSARMPVETDDELGRLAESHNRLVATLGRRNRSLAAVSQALASLSPREGVPALVEAAERSAVEAFGFTRVQVALGPDGVAPPAPERIPGEAYEVRAPLAIGGERLGTLAATQVPTREWGPADEDLLRIFAIQLAAAIRNAELFEAARGLAELKDEFLRGVSHNLQTPLTSIRAFAGQLAERSDDRRLGIIVEQADRLSRLVGQLLTVSRIEAGTLRPEVDVFAIAPLVQRAWESLGRPDHPFSVADGTAGWLAAADRDWVDQVVWALFDNALRYGGDGPIEVSLTLDPTGAGGSPAIVTAIRDHGPGIAPADRELVYERFTRLGPSASDGSGLGLSVARGLVEAMGGRAWVADPPAGGGSPAGASFAFSLPAEPIEEA